MVVFSYSLVLLFSQHQHQHQHRYLLSSTFLNVGVLLSFLIKKNSTYMVPTFRTKVTWSDGAPDNILKMFGTFQGDISLASLRFMTSSEFCTHVSITWGTRISVLEFSLSLPPPDFLTFPPSRSRSSALAGGWRCSVARLGLAQRAGGILGRAPTPLAA